MELLKEKIVEINNKDIFIRELTETIEEMRQKISDLTAQLNHEKKAYEEKLEVINENYEVTLNDLHCKHNKEMEHIKCKIKSIENALLIVKEDYKRVKDTNNLQLNEFKKQTEAYDTNFSKLCLDFKAELKSKETEIRNKEQEVETMQVEYKKLEKQHMQQIAELKSKHMAEVQEIEYEMLKTVTELQKLTDKEKRECAAKIKQIETEKQQEIDQLVQKYEEEQQILQTQSKNRIKQMEEDFKEANILADIQMKQRIEDVEICYKIKLEAQAKESEQILKECQAISEYNIIQCEVEKNHIKAELTEKSKECELLIAEKENLGKQYEELQKQFAEIQEKFEAMVKELSDTQKKLQEEMKKTEEQSLFDERAYEITIKQLHGTIEALKKRLLSSDGDVEQLKSELDCCEKSKLAVEDKCNKLQEELQQVQNLNEELEMQNESSLKLTEEKIQSIETALLQKVDDYRAAAEMTMRESEEKLRDRDEKLRDAMEQLHEQQKITNECHNLIKTTKLELERLEAINTEYQFKNNRLENTLKHVEDEVAVLRISEKATKEKLLQAEKIKEIKIAENEKLKQELKCLQVVQEENETYKKQLAQHQKKSEEDLKLKDFYKNKLNEYEAEIEECSCLRKKYIEQSGKFDELLHRYELLEMKNVELETKVREQESLIGPFREQLQAYEMEHNALINEKHDAENEAKEMGLKYAAILGHQNQKQKIKYLVELQTKKFELIEVNIVVVVVFCCKKV